MGLCVMCAFFLVLLMMPPLLVAMEKRKEHIKARVVDISSLSEKAFEEIFPPLRWSRGCAGGAFCGFKCERLTARMRRK